MDRNFELKIVCQQCGKPFTLKVNRLDYMVWLIESNKEDANIADYLPYLEPLELQMIENELCGCCIEELDDFEKALLNERFEFDPCSGLYTIYI